MKKILYFSMIAFLWQLSTSAHAASCVSVKQVSTNYATKTVTFVLSWSGCNGTNHLNTVWCFIDWRTVDAAGNKGAWTHATINGTPTVTGASLGSVQTDGFWVTGTSSATVTVALSNAPGMFDWCAFASDCGSTKQAATIAGCSNSTMCLGETGFVSTQTWVVGAQTWSAPVTATYCNKTNYNGGSSGAYRSDCRTGSAAAYGHLFSWCIVVRFKETICPSGWHVPTRDEFLTLYNPLGNSLANFSNRWGHQWSGHCTGSGSLINQGFSADYWSQSEYSSANGYNLTLNASSGVYPQHNYYKQIGFTLRCVK